MVLWGQIGRPTFRRCDVVAYDAEEALVEGASLHPEWARPRVALLVDGTAVPQVD